MNIITKVKKFKNENPIQTWPDKAFKDAVV